MKLYTTSLIASAFVVEHEHAFHVDSRENFSQFVVVDIVEKSVSVVAGDNEIVEKWKEHGIRIFHSSRWWSSFELNILSTLRANIKSFGESEENVKSEWVVD